MLNTRAVQILKKLYTEDDYISVHDLAEFTKSSSRSVRYNLQKIDSFLRKNRLSPLQRHHLKGVKIDKEEKTVNFLAEYFRKENPYGFPVVYNPYLFLPFVIGTPLLGMFSYFIFDMGWVRAPIASVGGMPTPIAQYLVTLDWKAVLLVPVILGLAILMYYPFFKIYEKSVLKKEELETRAQSKEEDVLKDLDLDF